MELKYNSIEQHVTPRPRSKRLREVSGGAVVTGQGTSSVEGGLGDGHTHANLKDLDKISFDDEKYLYVTQYENDVLTKGKVKCGTADNLSANSADWDKILLKATFDDLFEKVNIGTASNPVYVIRAKYSLYSDGGISAYGASDEQGGGETAYDRLDKWADYGADKAGYVLSALLGNDLNERLKTVESGSVLEFSIDGTGNAVTGVNTTGNKVVLTKGVMFALSSHTHSWSEIGSKPSTLAGYGITDANITNGVITLGGSSITPLTSHQSLSGYATESWVNSKIADMFEKVNIGTASNPVYAIRAKFSLYSDGGISAYGTSNGQGGGGTAYDRLDKWADYGADKAGYVLSALLGNDLNERLKTVESGSVLEFSIEGTGNAVTGVNITGNKVVLTKGVMFALSSHTHSFSEIKTRPSTLAGYGITDANITNGVITLGGSSITPLISHQSLSGYATENWVSNNFNKYVLPIASAAVAGGVMVGNGLNISSGVLSVGYGSVAGTACQGNDARLSDSRPASDVYSWAKQSSKPGYSWNEIGLKPTTLAGYGITDANIANGVISIGGSSIVPLTSHQSLAGYATESWVSSKIADMFEKVNLGTTSNPIYAIRAKYSLYSDGGISAYGATNGQGGGGTAYDRLDKWADYGADKAGYVLSALLGNDLNERLKTVESGSVLDFCIDGTGNAVTGINKTGNKVVLTKGAMFALSSHTHSWSEIGSKPSTIAGYGITDANIANGVISIGGSSITPLTSHQSLAGYATENWVNSNFNKYVLPIASSSAAGGVMVGNGLNISSGVLSVGYGSVAGTACQGNDDRLSNSRPASDVYWWAKQSTKPTYSWSEIIDAPATTGILSGLTHADWPNAQGTLVTKSFMSYWTGAHNSGGSSNLTYCSKGAFGNFAVRNSLAYSELTGIPNAFTPSAHSHSWSEIGSKPSTIAGYGITDAVSASTLAGYLPLTGGTIRGVVQMDKDLDVDGTIYSPNFYCESSFILSGDSMHEHGKFSDMYVELSGENNDQKNYLVFKYKGTTYKITIS